MIEVNYDPTTRELRMFGLLWLLFFGAIGGLVLWRPDALAAPAVILAAAWVVSLAFNGENRARQLLGVLLPALFAATWWSAGRFGTWPTAETVWGVGTVGALLIWIAPALARRIYVGWMLAALPIGWTLSHLVLGIVYYGVLTPIGLIMRLLGRDPMKREFDREAPSYWIERPRGGTRPFRQF